MNITIFVRIYLLLSSLLPNAYSKGVVLVNESAVEPMISVFLEWENEPFLSTPHWTPARYRLRRGIPVPQKKKKKQ